MIKRHLTFFNQDKIFRFIGFFVFIAILFKTFCNVTYLFRQATYDRNHIVGIKQEDADLDMVYIGGSATFVYWQPLKAYHDCGFTSYNYATNSIPAENIKAYIEEVRACQEPDLFVIGVRAFQYYNDEQAEAGLRKGTDAMDMTSIARYKLLNDYFSNRTIEDAAVSSYYLDIMKYHTNTGNLGNSNAWGFINNEGVSLNKGWEWIDLYGYLEEPKDFATDERAELPANGLKILNELLAYCQNEKLNVLFVVCPYYITIEDQAKYNTIGDIIKSYGFNFLNANEYYDEIGIDFTRDYYNKNHVNLYGAAKYTEFLENYILENYSMPDHRGDSDYSSWEEDYQRFIQEEEIHAKAITDLKADMEQTTEIVRQMNDTESLAEWDELAEDARYTLLIETSGDFTWPANIVDQRVLTKWGLAQGGTNEIRVISNNIITYTNASDEALTADGVLGVWEDTSYYLSVEDGKCSILINEMEMPCEQSGINVVVFDNNYREVVSNVTISCDEDGKMVICRK